MSSNFQLTIAAEEKHFLNSSAQGAFTFLCDLQMFGPDENAFIVIGNKCFHALELKKFFKLRRSDNIILPLSVFL
jgi:hypothetical protein